MSDRVFIDTNIFYNILFRTQCTADARKLLEDHEEQRFYTGLIVVNELLYISIARHYQDKKLAKGPLSLRKLIARKGYPKNMASSIKSLLEDLEVEVIVEDVNYSEMLEMAERLRLLPSDVIIALTCKRYGINTILTFDEDFKRVPWLKVIP